MTYTALNQLGSIGAKTSGNTQLTSFTLGYDKAAVHTVTDMAGNVTTYGYNGNNSLTSATQKTSGGTTLNTYGYSYDSAGNLATKTINGTSTTLTYNANNLPTQATGGMTASYSYNGQGDLTSRTVNTINSTFSYNSAGQLTSLNGTSMSYTGIGETQRVGAGSNSYQYDAAGIRKQTVGGTSSTFTTLPDGSILSETLSGSTYYYLSDGMGNVAALTDSTGTIVDQYSYDPMGNIASSSGSVSNPFTFQGWMYDSTNNVYYTGSGYYDPATGQSIGCKDHGAIDPGEDGCGIEDEDPACNGVCSRSGQFNAYMAGREPEVPVDRGIVRFRPLPVSEQAAIDAKNWLRVAHFEFHPTFKRIPRSPVIPPGNGWSWRGSGPKGSVKGSWFNRTTGESLHPDWHTLGHTPHWDYYVRGFTPGWRIYPDGTVEAKP